MPAGPNNLTGLDYRRQAATFAAIPGGLIDMHTHIHGDRAARVFDEAARLYGVTQVYSQTQFPHITTVKLALGDRVRFIAFPWFSDPDTRAAHREGYLRVIRATHDDHGARMLKIWSAPRLRELVPDGHDDVWEIDAPWRVKALEEGARLGMMFMVHVADPDTWFATKYADPSRYGRKRDHYAALERMLDRFSAPWVGAHMAGTPEDLDFLDGLLERHPNLYVDTSATKWIVRELSKDPARARGFFIKWADRIMFGTDIVSMDDHVSPAKQNPQSVKSDQASSPEEAFDLYASRYWALRTLLETDYDGPSPIADPDLAMVDPSRSPMDSPPLRGMKLPADVLRRVYHDNAERVLGAWWARGTR